MSNKIKTFYDSLYAADPGVFGSSSFDFLTQVLDTLPFLTRAALDVGAGQGLTSNLLAERGFEVTAIDISEHAFKSIQPELNIATIVTPLENFQPSTEYALVHVALTLHHVAEAEVVFLLRSLQSNTVAGGIHVLRLFTNNSDFFKQSKGNGFYDDGVNLNEIYKNWKILLDETIVAKASTQTIVNEIRQVVFKKQ